jgi:hypothetical protein
MQSQNFMGKRKDGSIEQIRFLERSEVAYVVEEYEFGPRKRPGQILCVFAFDKFIVLAMRNPHRHADVPKITNPLPNKHPPLSGKNPGCYARRWRLLT